MIERFWGLGRISPCAHLIDKLLKSGIDSGVGGTPTFFLMEYVMMNLWDLKTFL